MKPKGFAEYQFRTPGIEFWTWPPPLTSSPIIFTYLPYSTLHNLFTWESVVVYNLRSLKTRFNATWKCHSNTFELHTATLTLTKNFTFILAFLCNLMCRERHLLTSTAVFICQLQKIIRAVLLFYKYLVWKTWAITKARDITECKKL